METIKDIVALDSKTEQTGAIVWWRLSGTTDGQALSLAWADAGLDAKLLPDLPSPESAMRRAVTEQRGSHRLVRALEGGNGWAIVDERPDGVDLSYAIECRVKLTSIGTLSIEPADHPLASAIRASYQQHLDQLSTHDISGWLTKLTQRHANAVSLRDTGGVYFVPRTTIGTWELMVAALELASAHCVIATPAMAKNEKLMMDIINSVATEAEADAKALEDELGEKVLSERSLEVRAARAETILAKVQAYESLLGIGLDTMRKRLEDLQVNITMAIMQQQAAAELAA